MSAIVLANHFPLCGGIVVFFRVVFQFVFITLKELRTFFVLITLPSVRDLDNISFFRGKLLLQELRQAYLTNKAKALGILLFGSNKA